jgi:hypothetical protein
VVSPPAYEETPSTPFISPLTEIIYLLAEQRAHRLDIPSNSQKNEAIATNRHISPVIKASETWYTDLVSIYTLITPLLQPTTLPSSENAEKLINALRQLECKFEHLRNEYEQMDSYGRCYLFLKWHFLDTEGLSRTDAKLETNKILDAIKCAMRAYERSMKCVKKEAWEVVYKRKRRWWNGELGGGRSQADRNERSRANRDERSQADRDELGALFRNMNF